MTYEPELGQMAFGNRYEEFGSPEYVDAFVDYILWRIKICVWNRDQADWDRYSDPKIAGLECRGYYWGDDDAEADKPNLKIVGLEPEIRWYKHPGRGQTVNLQLTADQWVEWFDKAVALVKAADDAACDERLSPPSGGSDV